MYKFETIDDVRSFINNVPMFGKVGSKAANFDLNNIQILCSYLNNPQEKLSVIHVAGTNGKGTVCRMLGSVYQSSGYKTGVYISPHLLQYNERFLINGEMIPDAELVLFFRNFGSYIQSNPFTYFEISTALAFWYFAKENVDIAIIETGLGGRLDATNIVDPLLAIITSIGLDHTEILGNSLPKIAAEKAGIIKKGKPVIIGNIAEEARSVIRTIANKKQAKFISIDSLNPRIENFVVRLTDDENGDQILLQSPYKKNTDGVNIAIVYKSVKTLESAFPVPIKILIIGIESSRSRFKRSGVFEILKDDENWFFDGAHNSASISTLTEQLNLMAPSNKWLVVLSFMKDKLTEECAAYWREFPYLYVYSMPGERAATMQELLTYFPHATPLYELNSQIKTEFERELVIFSGSFYFYSIVSDWLGTSTAT